MKQIVLFCLTMLIGPLFLGGCTRIVDWGRTNFYQGDDVIQFSREAQRYIRSVTVYNQLRTVAIFDALWLCDPVRNAYTDSYALKRGKSLEQKQLFLRRQLEENNHFISFYVLSIYTIPLGQSDGSWQLLLEINGNLYTPLEIKQVELTPEYRSFFSEKCNRFRTPYLVKFAAKDVDDKSLITENTKYIALHFRSIKKHTSLIWDIR